MSVFGAKFLKGTDGWQADDVEVNSVSSVFQLKNFNLVILLLSGSLMTDCLLKPV